MRLRPCLYTEKQDLSTRHGNTLLNHQSLLKGNNISVGVSLQSLKLWYPLHSAPFAILREVFLISTSSNHHWYYLCSHGSHCRAMVMLWYRYIDNSYCEVGPTKTRLYRCHGFHCSVNTAIRTHIRTKTYCLQYMLVVCSASYVLLIQVMWINIKLTGCFFIKSHKTCQVSTKRTSVCVGVGGELTVVDTNIESKSGS